MSTTRDRPARYGRAADPPALSLFVALELLAGGLVMVLSVLQHSPFTAVAWWQPVLAVGIGALADLSLIKVRFGHNRRSFTWAEAFLLPGLALVPAPWLVVGVPIGVLSMRLALRRPLHKAGFNAMGMALGTFLAAEVFWWVHGGPATRLDSTSTLVGLGLASLVFFAWNHCSVSAAIALSQGVRLRQVAARSLSLGAAVWMANTVAGIGLVALYLYDRSSLYMLPLFLGLVYLVYRNYLRATQEADTWRLLQSVGGQLSGVDVDELARSAMTTGADLFDADFVELMITGADGQSQVCRWAHRGVEISTVATDAAAPEFWPHVSTQTRVVRAHIGWALPGQRREMRRLGVADLISAPLLASGECLGMIRVGFVEASRAMRRERQVLPTFANQVAASLQTARLFDRTRQMSEQSRAIADSLAEGVIAVDTKGLITFANPAAAAMVGRLAEDLTGHSVHEVFHGREGVVHAAEAACPLLEVLTHDGTTVYEDERFVRPGSGTLPASVTASPLYEGSRITGAVMALRDMSERRALEAQISYQALHDPTTDLANRSLVLSRLQHALGTRAGTVGILFMDLDRFKVVNDSLGHRAGDALLRQVAQRVASCLGPRDTLGRWGDDEFMVLVESVADEAEIIALAKRILAVMGRPYQAVGREVILSLSIGVAANGADLDDAQRMVHGAEVAMREAKKAGRDTLAVFGPEMEDRALERLELEASLRRALEAGDLRVHYQPIVSVEESRLSGVEALVRWNSNGVLLSPAEFIGVAEETGLILPLGRMVLEEACRTVKAMHDAHPGPDPIGLSVNLSGRQFLDGHLGRDVAAILASTGLEARHLCLEITETVVMQNLSTTLATLAELKALGVQLAIDDFGTGYSSLSYLKKFPVDVVKIDKSFVDGLGEQSVDTEIVAAVIRMTHSLGMKTVAEGVETPLQLEMLRELGCPLIQGYFYSPAVPAERIEAMVERQMEPGAQVS
ncbi:MAG: putative bifunctional diguanylate cyclase/phosphodiesterase [Acidimicrobiales bacterium]